MLKTTTKPDDLFLIDSVIWAVKKLMLDRKSSLANCVSFFYQSPVELLMPKTVVHVYSKGLKSYGGVAALDRRNLILNPYRECGVAQPFSGAMETLRRAVVGASSGRKPSFVRSSELA